MTGLDDDVTALAYFWVVAIAYDQAGQWWVAPLGGNFYTAVMLEADVLGETIDLVL